MTTLTLGEAVALGAPVLIHGQRAQRCRVLEPRDDSSGVPHCFVELWFEGGHRVLARTDTRVLIEEMD